MPQARLQKQLPMKMKEQQKQILAFTDDKVLDEEPTQTNDYSMSFGNTFAKTNPYD